MGNDKPTILFSITSGWVSQKLQVLIFLGSALHQVKEERMSCGTSKIKPLPQTPITTA